MNTLDINRTTKKHPARVASVLVIEDNPADIGLLKTFLEGAQQTCKLQIAQDGEEALNYLNSCGTLEKPRPDLIIMDLNLPRMDGKELLSKVKARDSLKGIPVLVLTTSDSEDDVRTCYQLGANCYLNKPGDLEAIIELFQIVENFWLKSVRLPQVGQGKDS